MEGDGAEATRVSAAVQPRTFAVKHNWGHTIAHTIGVRSCILHSTETPRRQSTLARPSLAAIRKRHGARGAWITAAHDTHGYTLAEIAATVGLHYASVSRIIKARREDDNARYKT